MNFGNGICRSSPDTSMPGPARQGQRNSFTTMSPKIDCASETERSKGSGLSCQVRSNVFDSLFPPSLNFLDKAF